MTASTPWRLIVALASILASSHASAILIPSEEITLTGPEHALLEKRICGEGQKADQIRAERVETDPVTIQAHVVCAPHTTLAGYPALNTGECEKAKGKWRCDKAVPALRMSFRSEALVLEYTGDVSPEAAVEVMRFVNGMSTFNGRDVSLLLVGRCRISDGRTKPFPGAVKFRIRCEGPVAEITKDCWDDQCRMFFTDFGVWVP